MNDFSYPTPDQIRQIEENANRMRAEVMRNGLRTFVNGIRHLPQNVAGLFRTHAHN